MKEYLKLLFFLVKILRFENSGLFVSIVLTIDILSLNKGVSDRFLKIDNKLDEILFLI